MWLGLPCEEKCGPRPDWRQWDWGIASCTLSRIRSFIYVSTLLDYIYSSCVCVVLRRLVFAS